MSGGSCNIGGGEGGGRGMQLQAWASIHTRRPRISMLLRIWHAARATYEGAGKYYFPLCPTQPYFQVKMSLCPCISMLMTPPTATVQRKWVLQPSLPHLYAAVPHKGRAQKSPGWSLVHRHIERRSAAQFALHSKMSSSVFVVH